MSNVVENCVTRHRSPSFWKYLIKKVKLSSPSQHNLLTFPCFPSPAGDWSWTHSAVFFALSREYVCSFFMQIIQLRVSWRVFRPSESFTGRDFAPRRFGTGSAPLSRCSPSTKLHLSGASWWISGWELQTVQCNWSLDSLPPAQHFLFSLHCLVAKKEF